MLMNNHRTNDLVHIFPYIIYSLKVLPVFTSILIDEFINDIHTFTIILIDSILECFHSFFFY